MTTAASLKGPDWGSKTNPLLPGNILYRVSGGGRSTANSAVKRKHLWQFFNWVLRIRSQWRHGRPNLTAADTFFFQVKSNFFKALFVLCHISTYHSEMHQMEILLGVTTSTHHFSHVSVFVFDKSPSPGCFSFCGRRVHASSAFMKGLRTL